MIFNPSLHFDFLSNEKSKRRGQRSCLGLCSAMFKREAKLLVPNPFHLRPEGAGGDATCPIV